MAHIKVINIDPELRKDFRAACAKRGISMSKRLIELAQKDVAAMKLKEAATVLSRKEIDELRTNLFTSEEIDEMQQAILSQEEISELVKVAEKVEKNRLTKEETDKLVEIAEEVQKNPMTEEYKEALLKIADEVQKNSD